MYIYDELANEWVNHRDTALYQLRKSYVKDMWLILIASMLLLPVSINILMAFFGLFATLTYLDENKYYADNEMEIDD